MTGLLVALTLVLQSQDTLVVRADNPPVWGDAPRLIEEVRLGNLNGSEEQSFGAIRGVVQLDGGEVWVADGLAAEVRRFDVDGRFLGYVGRKGEGPGELQGIAGMKRMPDGRVVVFDPWAGRINFFDSDGSFESSAPRATGVALGPHEVFQVDTAGSLYQFWIRPPPDSNTRASGLWFKLDSTGEVVDSIPVPPSDRRVMGGQSYAFGDFGAFSPRTLSAMSPFGYLVRGRNDEYALDHPLPDGRVLRIERAWEPIPIQRRERSQFRAHAAHVASLWGSGYGLTDDIPETKPPFWAFRIDDAGRYWVARHDLGTRIPESDADRERRKELGRIRGSEPPPMEWWEPLTVDVIAANGQFMGTLQFPNTQSVLVASRGDTAWVVERGAFDEEYLVRYRIVSG